MAVDRQLPVPGPEDEGQEAQEAALDRIQKGNVPQGLDEPVAPATRPSRWNQVASAELNPLSLLGSFCHKIVDGQIEWAGLVVCEAGTGNYLIELRKNSVDGAKHTKVQVPVTFEQLARISGDPVEWRFYDSEEAWLAAEADTILGDMPVKDE